MNITKKILIPGAALLLLQQSACRASTAEPSDHVAPEPSMPITGEAEQYDFNDGNLHALMSLLYEDAKVWNDGGQARMMRGLTHTDVSATEFQRDIVINRAAALEQYDNRPIGIDGTVRDVHIGLHTVDFVELDGTDAAKSPQIRFVSGVTSNRIAELRKGQHAKFVCQDVSEMMGTPLLNECEFAMDAAHQYAARVLEDALAIFGHVEPRVAIREDAETAAMTLVVIARVMNDSQDAQRACAISANDDCGNVVATLVAKMPQRERTVIFSELEHAGIISTLKAPPAVSP